MKEGALGKLYAAGDVIVRQGDEGDCMFVIQAGEVEVLQEGEAGEVQLAVLGAGDFLGEMAIFERVVRSATVRALGEARLLTIDKKTFLRRIAEDASLAFRIVQKLSGRIRDLNAEVTRLKTGDTDR
jgi:CRP-like cAMP-binding protein